MANKGYIKFLHSKTWKDFRGSYYSDKNIEKRHCFICGSIESLNLHHFSYKRDKVSGVFGLTDPANVLILCRKCHKTAHKNPTHSKWVLRELTHTIPDKIKRKQCLKKKEKQLLKYIDRKRKIVGVKMPEKWNWKKLL